MIQLYFLSVLCNGLAGYILFADISDGGIEKQSEPLSNPTFHLVLGILSAVVGFLKLLSPMHEKAYIIGDFLPAVVGIFAGFMLVFGIYRKGVNAMSESYKSLDSIASSLLKLRKPLSLAIFGIALLHFLFPRALFL